MSCAWRPPSRCRGPDVAGGSPKPPVTGPHLLQPVNVKAQPFKEEGLLEPTVALAAEPCELARPQHITGQLSAAAAERRAETARSA